MIDLFSHPHRQHPTSPDAHHPQQPVSVFMPSRSTISVATHTSIITCKENISFLSFIQNGTPDKPHVCVLCSYFVFVFCSRFFVITSLFYFQASGQAVVAGVVPSLPWLVPSISIAHRVQQSSCSSAFVECCYLTLSRFPQVNLCTSKSPSRIYTCVQSGRFEHKKLAFYRLEYTLIHHGRPGKTQSPC